MYPLISVVTTVCNQGDWVRKTLPLIKESLDNWPHEIIVVDDQSIDGSCHGLGSDIRIIRTETRHGVSASRRLGVHNANGDVFLFTDPHCEYPNDVLSQLAACAMEERAIVIPRTVSLPVSRKPRFGGFLDKCDRGLKVSHSRSHPARWPALLGTIYAMNRDTYEFLGGWPELPGVWGYSEQALSLMAWFSGVPIQVATQYVCNHQHYHPNEGHSFNYRVPRAHQANNGHWIHAGFFPETYDEIWAPLLKKRFGRKEDYWSCLSRRGWEAKDPTSTTKHGRRTLSIFREEIASRAVRTEKDFFQFVLNLPMSNKPVRRRRRRRKQEPVPITKPLKISQESYIRQQARRSKPNKDKYEVITARQDRAIKWFLRRIPGCMKGRKILDLGARVGYMVNLLDKMGAKPEGIELVPETAKYAREELGRNIKEGDMRHLPYKDGEWHCITCIHSLEHVPDPQTAVDEMLRVLMPRGWFLVVVPIEETPSRRHSHNYAFKDVEALKALFDNAQVEKITTDVKSLKPRRKEILLLGRKCDVPRAGRRERK